ncbi:MAG: NusG domain II-containing protein [Treponema sp.]|nr:NusG domain II-containing protein [Treponema sp.]
MKKAFFPFAAVFSLFPKRAAVLFKPLDAAVALLSLGAVVFSGFAVYAKPHDNAQVSVRGQDGAWIFPLDAEDTATVHGPLGDTVVAIHGGRVRVLSSPCDNQTCVAQGEIKTPGEWIACLPNNVFAVIESDEKDRDGLDANTW